MESKAGLSEKRGWAVCPLLAPLSAFLSFALPVELRPSAYFVVSASIHPSSSTPFKETFNLTTNMCLIECLLGESTGLLCTRLFGGEMT